MTTTPPRHTPRLAWSRTNVRSESPIRVPPSQSKTTSAARASASSGRRRSSERVIRVSRVPKQNTSTRVVARRVEYANCSRLRE